MVSGCLHTHDKMPLSALESNWDCKRSSSPNVYICLLHKAASDRKARDTSLFFPLCVTVSILSTAVMANEDSNIRSDGVQEWQGVGPEPDCCVKIPWYARYLRSLGPTHGMILSLCYGQESRNWPSKKKSASTSFYCTGLKEQYQRSGGWWVEK